MKTNFVRNLCMLLVLTAQMSFGQVKGLTPSEECELVRAADLHDAKAPSFAKYPAMAHEEIPSPKLDLESNPIARIYRTQLRHQIASGSNYAGHYTVAFWGCGSSCTMLAVVNLRTGKVMTPREFTSVSDVYLVADDFLSAAESDAYALRYKVNSTLLVVIGAPDEDESKTSAFYYVIQDEGLHLIHTTHVTKKCENVRP